MLVVCCGFVFAQDNDTQSMAIGEGDDGTGDDVNGSNNAGDEGYDEDYETIINNNMGIQEDDVNDEDEVLSTGVAANSTEDNATSLESDNDSPQVHDIGKPTGNPIALLLLVMAILGINIIYKKD